MTKVMEGIRVLEVAQYTFVPAAGAILADWGADVIKIEHPVRGDTQRGFLNMGGVTGGTGIRYLRLTYPDAATVAGRFTAAGFAAPEFRTTALGQEALVNDPAGLPILLVIDPNAQDHSDDGVGVER